MEEIRKVEIYGEFGCALLDDGRERYILKESMMELRPIYPLDNINMLLGEGIEISGKNMKLSWIKQALALEICKARALSNMIAGMDGDLDKKMRVLAIGEVNGVLGGNKNKNIRRFLKKKFAAAVLVECADIEGAIKIADKNNFHAVRRLYTVCRNK